MHDMFTGCCSFKGKGVNTWNVSNVTNFDSMFYQCVIFDTNLGNWKLYNKKQKINMNYMFYECINFQGNGLEKWNVFNVSSMEYMFDACKILTGEFFKFWDVSNVETMHSMFVGCTSLNCDMTNINVSKAIDLSCMFYGCK